VRRFTASLLALFFVCCVPAWGQQPLAPAQRVTHLSEQLRCLVCQNQSLAESNAPLALDLKQQVAEKVGQGWSDEQVVAYMVERYGDFVLYKPPVKSTTWLLWFGPALLLMAALVMLYFALSRQRKGDATLSEQEMRRAEALLNAGQEKERLR